MLGEQKKKKKKKAGASQMRFFATRNLGRMRGTLPRAMSAQ